MPEQSQDNNRYGKQSQKNLSLSLPLINCQYGDFFADVIAPPWVDGLDQNSFKFPREGLEQFFSMAFSTGIYTGPFPMKSDAVIRIHLRFFKVTLLSLFHLRKIGYIF